MLDLLPNVVCVGFILVFLVIPAWARMQWKEWRARKDLGEALESGRAEPVTMLPFIDPARCMGSGACVTACPEDVLRILDGQAVVVDGASCVGHAACVAVCPVDAIQLVFGSEQRGVDIPEVDPNFQTNVPGLFIAGELGGMGLIANAVEQGTQALENAARALTARDDRWDVLIVGAGPAGLAAASAAAARKLRYVVLEQEEFGGAIRHYPRQKLVFSRPMQFRGYGKIGAKTMVKEDLVDAFHQLVRRARLEIRTDARVEDVTQHPDGHFEVRTAAGVEHAQRVILAVGRRGTPKRLGVPGEDQDKVSYWLTDAALYRNVHVLVVGGGDSAIEAAIALGEQPGNRVHLSYRRDKITRPKKKNLDKLREAVRKRRVELALSTEVVRIGIDRVTLLQDDDEIVLPNDYVFVFAGGVLPTDMLTRAGIRIRTHYGKRVTGDPPSPTAPPMEETQPPQSEIPSSALSRSVFDDATLTLPSPAPLAQEHTVLRLSPVPALGRATPTPAPRDATARAAPRGGLHAAQADPASTQDSVSMSRLLLGPDTLGGEPIDPKATALRPREALAAYLAAHAEELAAPHSPADLGSDFGGGTDPDSGSHEGTQWVRALGQGDPSALASAKAEQEAGHARAAVDLFLDAARQMHERGEVRKLATALAQAEAALVEAGVTGTDLARYRGQVLLLRGESAAAQGQWDSALASLEMAMTAAMEAVDGALLPQTLGALGRAWNEVGRRDLGEGILEEAWVRPSSAGEVRATALRATAALAIGRGQLDDAEAYLGAAWDEARATHTPDVEARTCAALADLRVLQGRMVEATELLLRAEGVSGDAIRVRAAALGRRVEAFAAAGRYGAALRDAEELLDLARRHRLATRLPEATAQLGHALHAVGFADIASEAASMALDALRSAGVADWAWRARIATARLLCDLGRVDDAQRALDALRQPPESPVDDPPAQVEAIRARLAPSPADLRVRVDAIARRAAPFHPLRAGRIHLDAALALLSIGAPDEARRRAKQGLEALQDTDALGARMELMIAMYRTRPDPRVRDAIRRAARRVLVDLPPQHADAFRARPVVADALG